MKRVGIFEIFSRDPHLFEVAFKLGFAAGDLAADLADLAFELAEAGFLRVFRDDLGRSFSLEFYVVFGKPVFLDLFRDQVAFGDLVFFFLGVTRQRNDLHPVAKRGLDGVEDIGGRHKHHVRQIESDAEIVVAKRPVLLRIEYLK